MQSQEPHLSYQDLLLAVDGELPSARAAQVAAHLANCWNCRARKQEIEEAIVDFVRLHRRNLDPLLPPAGLQRARLQAQLAEMPPAPRNAVTWKYAAGALALIMVVVLISMWAPTPGRRARLHPVPVFFPEPNLTPGAVLTVDREQLCGASRPKNRIVPASLQRKVFEEYGIPTAEPRAYEVDYLITPALGGAEDIRNLWPQSNSSTVWNARVKDALEDRLHDLVCDGRLDLATAQHDISSDWIAAYRKYFQTQKPLE